ncbi:expansin module family protein [Gigaspora rosea]|uniref:Expansin module family protein n=1 Tax=Gigaspora rosea TaxID=44941 RepID=A0A397VRH1_9GLOM|nr:expansin module family protein [Gigaspora rosea]
MCSIIKHLYLHLLFLITFSFSISESDSNLINSFIFKRGTYSGDGTFYAVGLGACGIVNDNDQMVAALPAQQFDYLTRTKACGSIAVVVHGGKQVTVKIIDRCAGCQLGDIDLSPAAFKKIAHPREGRVHVMYTLNIHTGRHNRWNKWG